jgi:hypothetical protein
MAAEGKQLEAVFIEVEVEDSIAGDADLARKLEEVCPVDIFTAANGRVETVAENHVKKLYDGTELRR